MYNESELHAMNNQHITGKFTVSGPATMRRNVFDIIAELMSMSTRSIELFSSVELISLGLLLLLPYQTFAANPASYEALAGIFPEDGWGLILLSLGVVQMTALIHWPSSRRYVAFIAMTIYALLTAGFFLASPISTGVVTYGVIAISQLWAYVRLTIISHSHATT
jgi:hypothetical protein